MATKQFKAESKRLMDMMINSIYTHREIFLRELISNASDAIDKLYYRSLTDESVHLNRGDFFIQLAADKDARTLTISDNGCGMTKDELENNLGTIARSGSLDFKKDLSGEDVDIIGQFGVGFYSAFMVSEQITVITRPFGSDEAYQWTSKGAEGYSISPAQKDSHGTDVILHIRPNTEEDNYDEYLQPYRISAIVKKYSDYIRSPIRMNVEKSRLKEGTEKEYETYIEEETLNSMIPIWRKNKSELNDEEYFNFYKDKFFDFQDPVRVIHSKTEGNVSYDALLFIPAKAPYNYYTKEFEKGLQLYSNGVLIMDKCADLLPDFFGFVKGLVDSADLSLNISRELLQHDRQLKLIGTSLQKKIKSELLKMRDDEREKYDEFFRSFGLQIKFGVYSGYGMNKDLLQDLILFYSSSEKKLVTLEEYVSRMQTDQKYIYYACGDSIERIDKLPQTELLKDKGFEILYLTEDVDEFTVKMMDNYAEKQFKSVSSPDLDIETEEEKKKAEEQAAEHKELFQTMQEALSGKVAEVRLSHRLKSHPVCLSNKGEITLEMEKVLNALPNENKVKAERILEINESHPIFQTLTALQKTNPEQLKTYSELLYAQALLIEGIAIDDPVAFSNAMCDVMTK